jgi:hypothetical protein
MEREKFDRDVTWPPPAREPDREPSHPDRIPDLEPGPFEEGFAERGEPGIPADPGHYRDMIDRDDVP